MGNGVILGITIVFALFFASIVIPASAEFSLTHVGSIKDNEITELYGAHDITVVGDYAYVASLFDDGLSIIDVSNPANPIHVGSITDNETTLLARAYSLTVVGDYAYITSKDDGGLEILDVSNPANPIHVSSMIDDKTTYTNPRNDSAEMAKMTVVGDYAFVSQYYGGLEILDVSNPANPLLVSTLLEDFSDLSYTPWDVDVIGDYAYIVSLNGGLSIANISDLSNPIHVGSLSYEDRKFRGFSAIEVVGDYAFVLGKLDNGISVIDISDPSNPIHVNSMKDDESKLLSGLSGMKIAGDYLYTTATYGDRGLSVIDISDPHNLDYVYSMDIIGAQEVDVVGDYVYVVYENTLGILTTDPEVSSSTNPETPSVPKSPNQTPPDTSEQVTLSKDLQNNPLAQEILQKIEQTKQWIAELEQRDYENIEKQKELDEKREQALEKLNADLAEWEKLWEYYSSRNSFERFVDKVQNSQVQEVFWDQFEFKEQKVNAGRDALKQVIADGGSLRDAIQAYRTASETKRIELIETNSQFNVNRNLAYYSQQVLFDKDGKFVDSPATGEQLRKHYEDYRTNPGYLAANPNDAISWNELGKTNADTECRDGQIVIHRFHADDYVCVPILTAEMWIQHGMGEVVGDSQDLFEQEQSVTPLTTCDDGFMVIFYKDTGKYSCVLESTANEWIDQDIAEFHDSEEFIMESIKNKESFLKVEEINQQIRDAEQELYDKKLSLKETSDKKYADFLDQYKSKKKDTIQDFNENPDMSKKELSAKISKILQEYKDEKENILKNKVRDIQLLEKEHEQKMMNLVQIYEFDPYIEIVLDSGKLRYEAILK